MWGWPSLLTLSRVTLCEERESEWLLRVRRDLMCRSIYEEERWRARREDLSPWSRI